jgi:hypothetical protein
VVPKEIKPCDQAVVTAELQNIGTRDGDEVTNYDGSSLFSFTIATLFSVGDIVFVTGNSSVHKLAQCNRACTTNATSRI